MIVLFAVWALTGYAQKEAKDTAQALRAVQVSASYSRALSTGNRLEVLDSNLLNRYAGNNLGELLNTESDVYVKSYGLGTLATTSIRGGGTNHTAILWNGFNLQSPLYGPQDLSLIPTIFFQSLMLQYGSSGATWGSGAVGGAIHLNNAATFNKGFVLVVGASMGSFEDYQQQGGFEWSGKRFSTSLKMMHHTAKNDFPFKNTTLPEQPVQRLSNAELKQIGIMNENYFLINEYQKINLRFWYQSADRNIPPSMSQRKNVSNQQDHSYRLTSEWQRSSERLILAARAGHFYETLIYDDSSIFIHSDYVSKVTIGEVESKFKLTRMDLLTLAINNTYMEAIADEYRLNPHQNRVAISGSYKIHNSANTLNGFLNVRQELINPDNQTLDTIVFTPFKSKKVLAKASRPFTYSIGGDAHFFKKISVNFSVAQHYRIPTFNDLYWAQGGNIHLKPESGWGEEIGVTFKHQYEDLSIRINATAFNRNIDNWILWSPISSGYWSPINVLKVWSRGAEYGLNVKYPVQKFSFEVNLSWNYTHSTMEKTAPGSESSLHKQLIYTPMYKGNGSFTTRYKNSSIAFNQKYVGYTYASSDHKYYLRPYLLSNIKVSHLVVVAGFKLQIFAGINNMFDYRYETIENRPMPGRNYQIGCTFYFNKPNNKPN